VGVAFFCISAYGVDLASLRSGAARQAFTCFAILHARRAATLAFAARCQRLQSTRNSQRGAGATLPQAKKFDAPLRRRTRIFSLKKAARRA